MKNFGIYISLFCLLAFTACKSYTPSMSVPDTFYGMNKLSGVEFSGVDTIGTLSEWASSKTKNRLSIANKYIESDIKKNFLITDYSSIGTLEIKCNTCYTDYDLNWRMLNFVFPLYPYYVFSLFGAPVQKYEAKLNYDFVIKDKNGNIIWFKNYTYEEETKIGLYYGKTYNRMVIDGAKDIMAQFRSDYIKDFSSIYAQLQNPKTKEQLAPQKPANLNIVFDKDAEFSSYAIRQKEEIFFIEIDGTYIGNINYGEDTRILLLPGEAHEIKIYANSKYLSDSKITYYDGYTFAKADKNDILNYKRPTLSEDNINVRIKRSWTSYWVEKNGVLSTLELAYIDKAQVYDTRNKNQVPLRVSKAGQTNLAQQTTVKENSKRSNVSSPQTITKQPIQNSHISQYAKSLVDTNIPQAKVNSENTYVLIISNEQYDQLDNVSYAAHDGEIFKEYCQKTLGIPDKQIFFYQNATYGRIVDGVEKLKYCLNNFENSKAIVYYCGHGIPDEKTGQAYLIPVDGKGTNMTTCYSLKNLYKTLAATKAQSITYFMDACFTGANKEGSMLVAARGVAREPMKETLAGKTVVFSASSGDETAMTLEEQGHGLFTYYLLKKLQETEGNVTYGELADYINKNVKKDAFLINEKPQTPVVATSPAVQNTWKTMKLK